MHVQNCNHKLSSHLDVATQLLQILTPSISNSLLCQKEKCTHQPYLENLLSGKNVYYPQIVDVKNSSKKSLPFHKGSISGYRSFLQNGVQVPRGNLDGTGCQ